MKHEEFENWGRYNSLCPCIDCRRKFKYKMLNLYKRTDKQVFRSAIWFEKAYFGKPYIRKVA